MLVISEIFYSLQGEGTLTGVPFSFIRLTGCNLRCGYCDTSYAFYNGKRRSFEEILSTIKPHQTKHVLVTGGEPLLQKNTPTFAQFLIDHDFEVSIETHGEISIEGLPNDVHIIMDIKTPGSLIRSNQFFENLKFLKPSDEIKFVITSEDDFYWAKKIIVEGLPTKTVLMSAVNTAENSPHDTKAFSAPKLADLILENHLNVRMQIQLHKHLWPSKSMGV